MIVVVPGTWWRSRPEWAATYALDNKPMQQIAALFGGEPTLFEWSGGNSPQARHSAAVDLARFLSRKSSVQLIGFSHGGNVASAALGLAADCDVSTLVTIATPVLLSQRYRPVKRAARHLHLYSDRDLMQRAGGEWLRIPGFGSVGWSPRAYPCGEGVRNIHVAGPAAKGLSGRHGDILWWDETWVKLSEALASRAPVS